MAKRKGNSHGGRVRNERAPRDAPRNKRDDAGLLVDLAWDQLRGNEGPIVHEADYMPSNTGSGIDWPSHGVTEVATVAPGDVHPNVYPSADWSSDTTNTRMAKLAAAGGRRPVHKHADADAPVPQSGPPPLGRVAYPRADQDSHYIRPGEVHYTARDVPRLREQTRHMWGQPIGLAFAKIDMGRSFGGDDFDEQPILGRRHEGDTWGAQTPQEYVEGQATLLRNASMYWVNRDMTTLLRHSATTIKPGVLDPTAIPHPSGFVVFEEAIPGVDAANPHNEHLRITAFGWGIVTVQGVQALHMEFYDRSARLFSSVDRELQTQNGLGEFYFLGASAWELGRTSDDFSGFYAPASDQAKVSFSEDRRLLHAFFLLIQQQVAVVTVRSPDRPTRRQAQRAGYTALPDVKIVTLREQYRPSKAPAGTRQVDWSHRWMTSGHWKQHWWPKEQIHVQTFIQPYPKGPRDKPLVVRPTVNAWKR